MKISDCLKNEKFLCFVGGFLAATYGVKAVLRDLSEKLFRRIHANYRFIALFNSGLILLGMGGVISPVAGALLHNISTMGVCLNSMKPLLAKEKEYAELN